MIHGTLTFDAAADRYTAAQLQAFRENGVQVRYGQDGTTVTLIVPLPTAQSNPALVPQIQLGPLLQGIGLLPQYRNDEQIDISLREILCPPATGEPQCVLDLGAIDLQRGRDHGVASYNDMRRAYGLPPKTSFTGITGESTESFPADPELTPGDELDDVDSLDFTRITNLFGSQVDPSAAIDDPDVVTGVRRTTLAARLKGIYGSVDKVEAFTGMMAEPHLPGSQFGELQQAIWTRQFRELRDGDRFFYGNQAAALDHIRTAYGIDYRQTLGDLIAADTDIPRAALPGDVFFVGGQVPPTACRVGYTVDSQDGTGSGTFTGTLRITNTGRRPIDAWKVRFRYADGQRITAVRDGVVRQNGTDVPISDTGTNGRIMPGQTRTVGIDATWTGTNTTPVAFTLNTTRCSP